MSTTSTAPTRNATKKAWADWLDQHDIDVPANASRNDLIALWELNRDDADSDDTAVEYRTDLDQTARDRAAAGLDLRPAPSSDDTGDDVPVELSFSTDSGERKEPERIKIRLDGMTAYLYEPNDALLVLLAGSFAPGADPTSKVAAMMDLLNASLDANARQHLRRMMYATDGSFDTDVLAEMSAAVIQRWAPALAERADFTVDKPEKPKLSRQQRRQAERANKKR
ncbi:hypothetical protein C6V83_18060 [Gordonia iterans]|uniref:Uncharacterized protein n=1 Tax=Gordonia iterans TaxID=1004901 RepID=A0A2S0KJP5_9ACTN|nr:hypothetical protein [Gordonia iterans]AVM01883.1 hypothetical protein C6V83_18060 [Gordonia iterans]